MAAKKGSKTGPKAAQPKATRERVMVVGPTGKRRFIWRDKV